MHRALCNIIEPIFDKTFIYESYANRKGKGTLKALERFEYFERKITKNYRRRAYVLKADIRHYFEEVDHAVLMGILKKKIKDKKVLWLIRKILENRAAPPHQCEGKEKRHAVGQPHFPVFRQCVLE